VALPKDGSHGVENLVDAYPEIEDYLKTEYGIDASMTFHGRRDTLTYPTPDHATWTKPRTEDDIIVNVNDINGRVFEVTISEVR